MIVCHCNRVSDRQVRAAVKQGAGNAGQVAERCGAGACCGGCRPLVDEIVKQERSARALPLVPALG